MKALQVLLNTSPMIKYILYCNFNEYGEAISVEIYVKALLNSIQGKVETSVPRFTADKYIQR